MKKQWKILLFALVVTLMLATMVVLASAAETTEDAEDAYYSAETTTGTKYYSTLAEAIGAVSDGGTVTVLKDVSEPAGQTFSSNPAKSYTICGASIEDRTATILLTDCNSKDKHGITFEGDNVTITNLKIDGDSRMYSYLSLLGGTLTLDTGVVLTSDNNYGIWLREQPGVLNVKEGAVITAFYNAIRVQSGASGSTVNVMGGTLTGTYHGVHGTIEMQGTTYLTISGGTIIREDSYSASAALYIYGRYANTTTSTVENSTITITGGTLSAPKSNAIKMGNEYRLGKVTLSISGTDASIETGARWIAMGQSVADATLSFNNIKVTLLDGATIPSSSYLRDADLSSVTLNLQGGVAAEVTEAIDYETVSTKAQMYDIVNALLGDVASEYREILGYTAERWHYLVLNNENATIRLAGDALVQNLENNPPVRVIEGVLIAINYGNETYTQGTHLFKVIVSDSEVYYYTDLQEAIFDVPNYRTIEVLDTADVEAINLDGAGYKTFTITGGASPKTLIVNDIEKVYSEGSVSAYIYIRGSRVTLKNLIIMRGTVDSDPTPDALVYLQNQMHEESGRQGRRTERVGHLILDGVKTVEAPSEWGVWIHRLCDLTIQNGCDLSGGEKNIVRMNNNSVYSQVIIKDSTLTGKLEINVNADDYSAHPTNVTIQNVVWTALPGQCLLLTTNAVQAPQYKADGTLLRNGLVINIESGSFTGSGEAMLDLRDGEINITGGTFTNAGPIVFFSNSKIAREAAHEVHTVLNIKGGIFESTLTEELDNQFMFHLAGERAKLVISDGDIVANQYVDAVIYSGSPSGIVEISGGSITDGKCWIDTSGSYEYIKDTTPEGGDESDADIDSGEGDAEQPTEPIILPSATTITVTGGTFTDNGQLTGAGIQLTEAQDGNNVLNLTGGSFALSGGKALIESTATTGTVNVGDLASASVTSGSALIKYVGEGKINFTAPISFSGTLLDVAEGTFDLASGSLSCTAADQYLIVVSGGELSITGLRKNVVLGNNAIKLENGGTLTVQGSEYLTTTASGNAYAVAIMGGTLNISGSFGNAGNLFAIPTGGALTLNDSHSMALSGMSYVFHVTGGTLSITGGTFTGDLLAVVHTGTLNISGGVYQSTGGNNYIFRVSGGNLNITEGTYENVEHLLYVRGGTATITGGSFTANREDTDACLINIDAIDETGCTLNISGGTFTANKSVLYVGQYANVTINGTAQMVGTNENWQSTISLRGKNINLTIGGKALIKQTGSKDVYAIGSNNGCVGLSMTVKETAHIVNVNSANLVIAIHGADAENAGNILFEGGTVESLTGACSVGLYKSNMTVTINGGTFKATDEEKGVFYIDAASEVKLVLLGDFTIDNSGKGGALIASDSGTNGAVVTLETQNGAYAMGAKSLLKATGGTITVQGGSFTTTATYFIHGLKANSTITVQSMTAVSSGNMFFLNSNSTNSVLNVESGNYTAPRMMYSYGKGTFNFKGGTFNSNASESMHFLHIPISGTTLNISGGTYKANKYNASIICCNNTAEPTLGTKDKVINITGGTFDGGQQWIFTNSMLTLSISNATFKDTDNTINKTGAIRIRTGEPSEQNEAGTLNLDQAVSVLINSGTFTLHADSKAPIFWMEEEILTINGGIFNADRIVSLDKSGLPETTAITINGGVFTVRGTAAIDLTGSLATDTLAINGGMFIIDGSASVISGDVAALKEFDLTGITVYGANGAKIYTKGSEVKAVPVGGRGYNFGATLRYFYKLTPATDSNIDVTNVRESLAGASIYINSDTDVSGLRFYTFLSPATIEALKTLKSESNATFVFGTVIAPVDHIIMAGGVFTMEALGKIDVTGDAHRYENIVANHSIRDVDGDEIPECYSATLINIRLANYDRDFASIPYVTVTVNGVSETYYGAFDSEINVRAIKDVATKLLEDPELYDADQRETLENYRDGVATAVNELASSAAVNTPAAVMPVAAYAGDKALEPSRKAAA